MKGKNSQIIVNQMIELKVDYKSNIKEIKSIKYMLIFRILSFFLKKKCVGCLQFLFFGGLLKWNQSDFKPVIKSLKYLRTYLCCLWYLNCVSSPGCSSYELHFGTDFIFKKCLCGVLKGATDSSPCSLLSGPGTHKAEEELVKRRRRAGPRVFRKDENSPLG